MSALSDIQREIDRYMALADAENGAPFAPEIKRYARARRLQVHVGKSVELSILSVTGDPELPEAIDDVPVVRADAFDGFAVVLL